KHDARERLVDLQRIEREMVQMREVRVTGAEVIQRDLDAVAVAEIDDAGDHDVIERLAFGDLDFETAARQAGGIDARDDALDQTRMPELTRGNVDGDERLGIGAGGDET